MRFLYHSHLSRDSDLVLNRYASVRKTFGKRLLDQPVIRAKVCGSQPYHLSATTKHRRKYFKLSDMGRTVEANHAWIEQICHHIALAPKSSADLDLAGVAALCKVSCTRGLEFCNREALQILGGIGFQRGGVGGRIEQM